MDTIKFAKVRENAIIPSKNIENAGYDIYGIFEGNEDENRIVYFNFGAKYVKSVNDDGKSTIYKYNYTENNGKYIFQSGKLLLLLLLILRVVGVKFHNSSCAT